MTERFYLQAPGTTTGTEQISVRLSDPPEPTRTAVLYMHGLASDQAGEKAEFFRAQVLAAGCTFCSFDFRGHGESGGSMFDLTLSRNLLDAERVHSELRRRGYDRIIVFGSSMGGLTGLWYSARHPDEVTAGLHLAPALGLAGRFDSWLEKEEMRDWRASGTLRVDHDLKSFDLGWIFIEDLLEHDAGRLAGLYRTPAILLHGLLDDQIRWQDVVDFSVSCPYEQLDVHLFADGDHRLIDRLGRLWSLMEDFLYRRGLIAPSEDRPAQPQANSTRT